MRRSPKSDVRNDCFCAVRDARYGKSGCVGISYRWSRHGPSEHIHLNGDPMNKCDLLTSVQCCFEKSLDDLVQSANSALVLNHFAQ